MVEWFYKSSDALDQHKYHRSRRERSTHHKRTNNIKFTNDHSPDELDDPKRVNQNPLRNYHNEHDNKDEKIVFKSNVNHEEFDEICSMEVVETIPSTLRTKGYVKNTSIIHSSIQKVCSISMIFSVYGRVCSIGAIWQFFMW